VARASRAAKSRRARSPAARVVYSRRQAAWRSAPQVSKSRGFSLGDNPALPKQPAPMRRRLCQETGVSSTRRRVRYKPQAQLRRPLTQVGYFPFMGSPTTCRFRYTLFGPYSATMVYGAAWRHLKLRPAGRAYGADGRSGWLQTRGQRSGTAAGLDDGCAVQGPHEAELVLCLRWVSVTRAPVGWIRAVSRG
jgi:hypothetical protein